MAALKVAIPKNVERQLEKLTLASAPERVRRAIVFRDEPPRPSRAWRREAARVLRGATVDGLARVQTFLAAHARPRRRTSPTRGHVFEADVARVRYSGTWCDQFNRTLARVTRSYTGRRGPPTSGIVRPMR